jgi:hypothetical protein
MERIVLEVNSELAKAWRNAPLQFREKLEKDIEMRIAEKIREAEKNNFFQLLDKVQKNAAEHGISQETLEKLLSEES